MNNDSEYDWRSGTDEPDQNRNVAFELICEPIRREGRFRNFLYIESGDAPKIWAARSVQRWVYLDEQGKMTKKVG